MKKLSRLVPGDRVDIIAPASRCSDVQLKELIVLLKSWQLVCHVSEGLFGPDLFCANSDDKRLQFLKEALFNSESKAIISARGGYGSMRLIPGLRSLAPPSMAKIFVGMSDTTALQLYLQQKWQWPTIHGSSAPDRFSQESIGALKSLLFGEASVQFDELCPLNEAAKETRLIESTLIGGNLSLVQASIGCDWQMQAANKIILLEEIGERGYRIDRMLQHLQQAGMFEGAVTILLGDFLGGNEPDGSSLVDKTLKRFAESCDIPVIQVKGVGHGHVNFPVPLGTRTLLKLGDTIQLHCAGCMEREEPNRLIDFVAIS